MKGLFAYDSPLGQVINFIADMFIVNFMFLLCCIPIVTIGPSLSGLYNAMRILQDPEDDNSPVKAFFRGFKSGFVSACLGWTLFFVFDIILFYSVSMAFENPGLGVHWGIPFVGLIFSLILQSGMMVFHSRFQCTLGQLIRNTFLLLISHPIRTLIVAVLACGPLLIWGLGGTLSSTLFWDLVPLFVTVYFSLSGMFGALVMKKPFNILIQNFYDEEDAEEDAEKDAEEA